MLFAVLLALLCLAGVRVANEADAAVEDGRLAEERQEPDRAVDHYRRAAKWALPVIGQQEFALSRLLAIAHDAEVQGRTELALRGYRGVRSAILGSRSGLPLDEARLGLANKRLSALMTFRGGPQNGTMAESKAGLGLDVLQRKPGADRGWAALAVLGLLCFLWGAQRLVESSATSSQRLQSRAASTVLLSGGFALFVAGLFAA